MPAGGATVGLGEVVGGLGEVVDGLGEVVLAVGDALAGLRTAFEGAATTETSGGALMVPAPPLHAAITVTRRAKHGPHAIQNTRVKPIPASPQFPAYS
jgi:hypothetical protein